MQPKYKILVSAYACSPYHGSEPGTGWNFIKILSEHHELHVITEEIEFKNDLENYVAENPKYSKIKFYYIPFKYSKRLRKIWPPSYYWYYKKWQKKAYLLAKELDKNENFDICHQLNQTGFREPGYLWKINKPFVWGPIGGMENTNWRFLPSMGLYGFLFFLGRNLLNTLELNFARRPRTAARRKNNQLIAAFQGTKSMIKKYWSKDSIVITEVGSVNFLNSKSICIRKKDDPLKIIWSGEHIPGKSLNLLLKAVSVLKDIDYELHILGDGIQNKKWKRLANQLKIERNIKWHGWLRREDALKIMAAGHVFCTASLRDGTPTVILEALSFGIPVICLDHCGFTDVIDQTCGIKIPLLSPSQVISEFGSAIQLLYSDEQMRQRLAGGAFIRVENFSWEGKMIQLNKIYNSLLDSN